MNERTFQRRLIQVAVASCFATAVQANPTGPSVVSGAATFNAVGKNLTVTNSPGAIINWQGFSIRPDEVTRFVQSGAASAVLNRVTGAEQSQLLGQLLSNGRVFLINPNGVTIGAGARIDTAGFVASSLNLSNEDFLAGKFRFTDPGNAGKVTNAGTINAHSGGPVYLVAPTVENHGVITAPNGDVMLAAGKSVELVSAASPHLRVEVQAGGEALNVGRLIAESGRVGLYGAAVRNSGTVSADSAQLTATGTVVLKASKDVTLDSTSTITANGPRGGLITVQAETGTLLADGRIEAKGSAVTGGDVRLLGTQVGLVGSAAVDASGATGGGQVLVGGDYQGKNPTIQNAARVVLAPDAKVAADATERGDGGRVIVWSDEYTGFHGAVSARGGAAGGNGGFVETSSKDNLQAFGTVDAAAPAGRAGEWLLDPRNVTIANAATSNGAFGGGAPNVFTPVGDSAVADRNTIQTSLNAGTSVTITTGATGTQAGDIVVQDSVTKTTNTGSPTLTLNAAGSIAVNNAIAGSAAGRVLSVGMNAGGAITFGGAGSINTRNGTVTMTAGGAAALGTVNAGSGALSVTSAGPITQNAGTTLTTTGATTLAAGAANDITLANATNSFANVRITSGNNVSIRDNTAFSFGGGASSVSGNLTVDSNGAVTQAAGATVAVGGTTTINTRAANSDVTLNLANDFGGAVSVVPVAGSTRNVNLQDTNALTLGTVTATGTLTALAAGAITDAGNLTITGTTTLTAGAANDITLDNANNFGGQVRIVSGRNVTLNDVNALAFGAAGNSTVSGNLSVTAGGAVTQANGLIVTGTTAINAGAANVTLANAANNFGGAVSVTGNNVSLVDANAIVLGTVNAAGTLAVTSNGAMTDTGNLAVAGTTTLTAGAANDITLDNANDFGGQVRIVSGRNVVLNDVNALAFGAGGASVVSGTLNVTAAGAITQANPLTVTGATTLAAGASNITLTNATNSFGNLRIASGNNVSIRDNTALSFGGGASTVSGALSVDSNGSVTQAAGGTLTVNGGMTVNTRGANADVTLNLANNVAGAVTIAPAAGTIRDVNYRNVNAAAQTPTTPASLRNLTLALDNAPVTLAATTLSGNLNVTAGGAITDTGTLAVTGTTTLTAGAANNITLDNANDFVGNVRVVSGNNVTLNDVNAFAFGGGASAVSGNLTLTTGGAVTQASALAVTGATSVNAGIANDVTLANAANDFGGAVSVAANDISLRDANALVLGAVTATTNGGDAGSLTLQAAGSVAQTGVVTTPALTATLTGAASALDLGTRPNAITALGTVTAPGGVTLTNGNVALAVNGNVTATNAPVSISTGTAGYTQGNFDVSAGNGPITITADAVAIAANTGNNAFATSGTLTLKPASAGQAMSLAGAAPFDLTQAELTAFATGVSGPIVIGDAAASTGTLTIGGTANLAGETLTLHAGSITDGANPGRTITAANLNLNARTGAVGSAAPNGAIDVAVTNLTVTTAGQNAYLNATGAVNLGAGPSNLGAGGLNLTSTGAITQSGAVTATGSSTFAAGAANNVTLANAANDFGTVAVASGNAVSLVDANALALGASTAGTLQAQTLGGDLTLNGAVTATGAGNSIVLASSANFVNNVGAGALVVPVGGRWIVYSSNPAGNTFNGLASGNQAVWGASFAGLPPTSPSMPGGNRYVFGQQPTVTLTSTNAAKVYGDLADVSTNYTATGFVDAAASGNVFTQDTVANSFAPFSVTSAGTPVTANAASYAVVIAATPTTGYAVTINSTGQLTVSPRPITVTPGPLARPYGDPNPTTTGTLTVGGSGLVNGNTITQVDVASPATATDPAGSAHALNASNAVFGGGGLAANYTISYAPGVLTIGTRAITVQANDQARPYGDANPTTGPYTITVGSLAGTDAIGSVNVTSPATAAAPAGSVWVLNNTGANFTSGSAANYSITLQNGQLTIAQRPISVQANDQSRPYGDPNPTTGLFTITAGSLAGADAIGSVNVTSPATAGSPAGSVWVLTNTGANFTTGSAANYAITLQNGQLTIDPRAITVQANNQARAYGDPNPVTGPYTITAGSLAGADSITNVNVTSPATVTSGIGPYALTPTAANFGTGTATNYTITLADGVLTVTPRPITVTANNQAKVYGQPDPALTFTAPTVNGDILAGALVRVPGEAVAAGPYAITQGTVTNANNPNYNITFVNGQLVITPAPLTIAADNKTRPYGDANPPLTATFTGLTNGDTTGAIPGVTLTTPAVPASNVGNYAINVTSGANTNYTITYVNGQLAITPAPLQIAADDKAKAFGAPNPPFTATATGFKLGQTVGDLSGTLAFTTPATTTSPPGAYAITPGGVSSGNYTITFVDGVLVVGQGAPPSDQALVTAVGRSESDPTGGLRAGAPRPIDCLTIERPEARRVLGRCF